MKRSKRRKKINIQKIVEKYAKPVSLAGLEIAGIFWPVCSRIGRIGQIMLTDDLRTAVYNDTKHGHVWRLCRNPKGKEWQIFDKRIENGEEVYDVLRDMKLLKN